MRSISRWPASTPKTPSGTTRPRSAPSRCSKSRPGTKQPRSGVQIDRRRKCIDLNTAQRSRQFLRRAARAVTGHKIDRPPSVRRIREHCIRNLLCMGEVPVDEELNLTRCIYTTVNDDIVPGSAHGAGEIFQGGPVVANRRCCSTMADRGARFKPSVHWCRMPRPRGLLHQLNKRLHSVHLNRRSGLQQTRAHQRGVRNDHYKCFALFRISRSTVPVHGIEPPDYGHLLTDHRRDRLRRRHPLTRPWLAGHRCTGTAHLCCGPRIRARPKVPGALPVGARPVLRNALRGLVTSVDLRRLHRLRISSARLTRLGVDSLHRNVLRAIIWRGRIRRFPARTIRPEPTRVGPIQEIVEHI